jgi:hypothetical protein
LVIAPVLKVLLQFVNLQGEPAPSRGIVLLVLVLERGKEHVPAATFMPGNAGRKQRGIGEYCLVNRRVLGRFVVLVFFLLVVMVSLFLV